MPRCGAQVNVPSANMHTESAGTAGADGKGTREQPVHRPLASRRELLLLVLCGLAVRFVWLTVVDYRVDSGDSIEYNQYAFNLLDHRVFSVAESPPFKPSVVRPPGYPAFLAVVYWLTGARSQLAVQLAQIALNFVCVFALAQAVAKVDRRAGRFMLVVGMLSPWDAIYNGAHLAESLTTSFLMLGMAAPLLVRGPLGLFASGASFAGAIMCRDVYLALVPLLAFGMLAGVERYCRVPVRRLRVRALRSVLFIAGAALVMLPWSFRNRAVAGRFILTSQGILGQALWTGSWEVNGDWFSRNWENDLSPDCCRTPAECEAAHAAFRVPMGPEREKLLLKLAFDRYRTEPFAVLGRWLRRAPRLWQGSRIDIFPFRPAWLARGAPTWFVLKAGLVVANVGGALLGVIGILITLRRRSPLLYFATPVVYTVGIFFPLHSTEVRYSTPAFSFLLLFAAIAVATVVDRQRRRAGAASTTSLDP